jgi:glycogen synthase
VSLTIDGTGMLDALHRAIGAWRTKRRRVSVQKRGMAIDWSWDDPTSKHLEIYEAIAGRPGGQ